MQERRLVSLAKSWTLQIAVYDNQFASFIVKY